jgi:alkylhydroperoxidase/carboxymuconolactone decarboxylase family protein YurZ
LASYPKQYRWISSRFDKVIKAHQKLGEEVLAAGPLKKKQAHLVRLAAAAASRSEGAVHSHVRRALEAGAKPEEIYHTLVLLVSTIGFPAASAALSWAREAIGKKKS